MFALASICSSTAAAAAPPQLIYYGGPVVSNPQVVVVSWGSGVDTGVQSGMSGFYAAILDSPYLDWVSEYSTVGVTAFDGQAGSSQRIGRGALVGSFTITPSTTGTSLTTDVIKSEMAAQIAAGHVPGPTNDAQGNANTIYMVNFPPGITIVQGTAQSCVEFCAIQDTLTIGGKSVGIGLVPDQSPTSPCADACGIDADYFKNATGVHSHILLNIITDVEVGAASSVGRPLAWYDPSHGQVSDACPPVSMHAVVAGYTVDKGWSNKLATCVASVTLPLCDGSTSYCRQCTAPDAGQAADCSGSTPVCETDATNVDIGLCVACTSNATCSGGTPVCARGGSSNDTCRGCTADAECAGNAAGPHCQSSGACGAAIGTDGGTDGGTGGGGSSSGCSTSGGLPMVLPGVIGLAGLLLRRRKRP